MSGFYVSAVQKYKINSTKVVIKTITESFFLTNSAPHIAVTLFFKCENSSCECDFEVVMGINERKGHQMLDFSSVVTVGLLSLVSVLHLLNSKSSLLLNLTKTFENFAHY